MKIYTVKVVNKPYKEFYTEQERDEYLKENKGYVQINEIQIVNEEYVIGGL
jgi:hypothetical protein